MVWVILHSIPPYHQVTVHMHRNATAAVCYFVECLTNMNESVFSYIIFEKGMKMVLYVTKTCFYLLMNKLTF